MTGPARDRADARSAAVAAALAAQRLLEILDGRWELQPDETLEDVAAVSRIFAADAEAAVKAAHA